MTLASVGGKDQADHTCPFFTIDLKVSAGGDAIVKILDQGNVSLAIAGLAVDLLGFGGQIGIFTVDQHGMGKQGDGMLVLGCKGYVNREGMRRTVGGIKGKTRLALAQKRSGVLDLDRIRKREVADAGRDLLGVT